MKTIHLAAALLLASSAAHAGSSIAFNVGGHNIRINAPRNCQSLSCLHISGVDLNGLRSGKFGSNSHDDDDAPASSAVETQAPAPSMPAMTTSNKSVAPVPQSYQQPQPAAAVSAPAVASVPVAGVAPTSAVPPVAPAPVTGTAAAEPIAPPVPIAPPAAAAQPAPVSAAASDPNSPLGLWATEENKGNVRIEPCGGNLCGYAEKSGEKVLINMRPKENKWIGRIHDPDGGGNYDSTIALKGPNTLRVQGCAFGGLFCGGQTWKRVG